MADSKLPLSIPSLLVSFYNFLDGSQRYADNLGDSILRQASIFVKKQNVSMAFPNSSLFGKSIGSTRSISQLQDNEAIFPSSFGISVESVNDFHVSFPILESST